MKKLLSTFALLPALGSAATVDLSHEAEISLSNDTYLYHYQISSKTQQLQKTLNQITKFISHVTESANQATLETHLDQTNFHEQWENNSRSGKWEVHKSFRIKGKSIDNLNILHKAILNTEKNIDSQKKLNLTLTNISSEVSYEALQKAKNNATAEALTAFMDKAKAMISTLEKNTSNHPLQASVKNIQIQDSRHTTPPPAYLRNTSRAAMIEMSAYSASAPVAPNQTSKLVIKIQGVIEVDALMLTE